MNFFDETGQLIPAPSWLKKYESYYFLDGPVSSRINRGNQTSRFVEDRVCALLEQSAVLSKQDLILLMAWKIGLIDHGSSEKQRKIIYKQNFDATLISKGRFGILDFSNSLPYLADRMPEIMRELAKSPNYLLDRVLKPHPELHGFGVTYILAVQFFVTHGRDPIYDQFAHIGAVAIHQDIKPGNSLSWVPVSNWSKYQQYVALLKPIAAECAQSGADSPMTVPRPMDRALWAYGHFFGTGPSQCRSGITILKQQRRDAVRPST
ncbi:MAG TPA: hypothetical protein VJP87_07835 [Candidatus Acidoferrales bacterium]|nr:hypothetical protein [Candidatus Acidoferrales bacterium]